MNRGIRDLECLNVVNLCDGKILGTISDVEIDTNCGKIMAVSVSSGKGIFQGISETIRICWDQIKCIGEDTILVEYKKETCFDKSNSHKKFSGWFLNF